MHLLQLLFRAGPAILLLVLCLQFRTNKAEEDTRKVLSMEVQMPRKTAPNEEISVTVKVQTELRECMVIQCSLLSRNPMEGPFNYVYTACLCDSNPRTFYWDFEVNKTMSIIALATLLLKRRYLPLTKQWCPMDQNIFIL
uniref:prolactin-inducible protein homolog n=1 Tax=Nyctereutes procyonoides TaxID=34880 RepID=UPI002444E204|nr:prolactin-inducible protein homolog [Nyctereutes procyonoides]